MMNFSKINEEVLYSRDSITKINWEDIAILKERALVTERKRIRLCAHPDVGNSLHEMLIVHCKGNYIPPHKHIGKSESFHIIEGALQVVLFTEDGRIHDIIKLDSTPAKDSVFYYRLSESRYHTVIPLSEVVVFHEITNGPFHKQDLVIPEWAPNDHENEATINAYISGQKKAIDDWRSGHTLRASAGALRGSRVLVVGSDGHIGQELSSELGRLGADVYETTRRPKSIGGHRTFLDLSADLDSWTPPESPRVSFVCAGVTSLVNCEKDRVESSRINVEQTVALANHLLDAGSSVVYMSTGLVLGGSTPFAPADSPYQPECEYARQKVEVERELLKRGGKAVVLRMTKVLSPEMPLIRGWIESLEKGDAIYPFSDLLMAPISLGYLVNVLIRLAASQAQGVYQVTGDRDISYADVATFIARKLGADEKLVHPITSREAGLDLVSSPLHTTLDAGRVKKEFGIEPADVWDSVTRAFPI